MRSIRLLNLRRLREQPVRALLAVVAIAAGTSLFVAVLIDRSSLDASFSKFVTQRAGPAKLEVHGPGGPAGLDESVLPKVAAVPGVKAAVPLVQVVTVARAADGRERLIPAFGVDCRIEAIVGDLGCDEQQLTSLPGAYVVSKRLATWLGESGVVRTDEGRLPIGNALQSDGLDAMNDGNIAVFPLADAQHLFGHEGALTSILVVPERGTPVATLRHDLQRVIGAQNLVDVPGTIGGAKEMASTFIMMLLLMSLFGLAIGAQLVHNTVALTLEERRRDLAVVGAIGAPGRVLMVGSLAEAAVLGALGGVLGIAGGFVVARPLVNGMSNTIDDMSGLHLGMHVSAFAVVAGVLLGVATSMFAAFGPARRASRMDVAAELHGQARRDETASAHRGRRAAVYAALSIVGLVLAYVGQRGGAIEPWQPSVALVGFGITAFLSFRAAQHGAAPLLALVAKLPGLRNGPARVAISNLAGEPKRTGVMVMALAAAVGTGVVLGNINGSIKAGSNEFITHDVLFGETLSANNSLGIAAKPTPQTIAAIAATPGVGQVVPAYGFCGDHPATVGLFCVRTEAADTATQFPFFRGRTSVADVFAHDEVLVGTALARAEGLRPGDRFQLPGRSGLRTVTVGAVWGDPDMTGRGITLPAPLFRELYGDRPASEVLIKPAPGVSISELERRLEAQHLDPDLKIVNGDELAADLEHSIMGFVTPFIALQRGMLVVALIAVTSTLLLVGVQRRREHGLLLAVGMAPGGLGRMVVTEAGIVGVTASVLGTAAGIVTYVAMMWVSPLLTGLSAPFHFELLGPLVYGVTGLVFVLAGASFPAWRTSRLDPALALRYE